MGDSKSSVYPMYLIDVFAKEAFTGSPAAVCFLKSDTDISDEIKQKIAAEMNQSVTAFVSLCSASSDTFSTADEFQLRWFTPTMELALCGHASLGATALLLNVYGNPHKELKFRTKRGTLVATQKNGLVAIDFPQNPALKLDDQTRAALQPLLDECDRMFGPETIIDRAFAPTMGNLLLRLQDDVDLVSLPVDPARFFAAHKSSNLKLTGIIITVKGSPKPQQANKAVIEYDFISRYFGPWIGVPEDYVCGSAHTTLGPYWTEVLGTTAKTGRQVSQRGGDVFLDINQETRIEIAANCKIIMKGEIMI